MNIEIIAIDSERTEENGFVVNRPHGANEHVFVHFLSEVLMEVEGEKQLLPSGTCILYTPGFAHYYTTGEDELLNSFFHFKSAEIDAFCKGYGIPVNKPFYLNDPETVEKLISIMKQKVILKEKYWEEIAGGLAAQVFMILAANAAEWRNEPSAERFELLQKFREVRLALLQAPERDRSVSEMAKQVNLCTSRFSIYYKEFFGVTPKADLIAARLEQAKKLLTNAALNISEIADSVGYHNVFHFIRQFKNETGYAPGEWRKINQMPDPKQK